MVCSACPLRWFAVEASRHSRHSPYRVGNATSETRRAKPYRRAEACGKRSGSHLGALILDPSKYPFRPLNDAAILIAGFIPCSARRRHGFSNSATSHKCPPFPLVRTRRRLRPVGEDVHDARTLNHVRPDKHLRCRAAVKSRWHPVISSPLCSPVVSQAPSGKSTRTCRATRDSTPTHQLRTVAQLPADFGE